jgi:Zn-dependent protease/CBS domain-containing protein
MKGSFKFIRIAGIDIRIHFSWLFIFVFFSWTLASGYFPNLYAGWDTYLYWLIGAATALLLFISVLIHELAHSLVAKAKGIPVTSITLFILGGVSNLEEEPQKAGQEFIMAFAGPATSLFLALVLWLITFAVTTEGPGFAILVFLWYMNLALGIFNLLPGFPMDGGRVLRSIIWGITKNLAKATDIATVVGQAFGWVFVAYGVFLALNSSIASGIWAAFLGWFLISSAGASRQLFTLKERLSQVKVRVLMNKNAFSISPETNIEEMANGIFRQQHDRAVPVCQDQRLIGIVTIKDISKVPQNKWPTTPVKNIMSATELQTVSPDDDLYKALQLIARNDINQVVIKDNDRCAGLLTRADIIRYVQMSEETGIPPQQRDKN